MTSRPLHGVRVLDMGRLVAPAHVSLRLAELGADVVKIELAPAGDYLRQVPPLVDGISASHLELNRGKRSLALDWTNPDAPAILRRLLLAADVFVDASLGSSAQAMGTDPASLRAINPGLITASITSFGHDTPYAELRAHGLNIEAAAGLVPITLDHDGVPVIAQVTHWSASQAAGLTAALCIASALFARERSGEGTHVDVSCWDAAVSVNYLDVVASSAGQSAGLFPDPRAGFGSRYNAYRTRDDKIVLLAAPEPRFWQRFCSAIGRDDLAGSAVEFEYSSTDAARERDELAREFALRTQDEWIALADQHRLPVSPAHGSRELPGLAQANASGILDQRTPIGDTDLQHVAFPAELDGLRPPVGGVAPRFSQHSRDVLRDYGFDDREIAAAVASGAVVAETPAG